MKSKSSPKPAPRKPEGNKNQDFRLLFENNPLPMWIYDLETLSFLDVNEAAVEQYGYSRNEFLNMRIADIRPAEDIALVEQQARAKRPRLQHSGEWRHCKKDGSVIRVEITSHTLTYKGHKAALVEARDVTERKRAEEALSASAAELRALFASIPDVILTLDRDGRYLKIAPTNPDLLYQSAETLLGQRMHDIFSRQKADELLGHIHEALDKKQTVQFEYALLLNDRIVWFSGTASPLTEDRVVWVGRDITARKLAEEALLASQDSLKQAQRIARIGSWELDIQKNALLWSDEVYRIFEIDPQTFGATHEAFLSAVHPEDRAMVDQAYNDSVKNQTPYSITHRLLFPDGRVKYVHESCETMYNGIGEPVRSIGIVQDITERTLIDNALQERLAELSIIYEASQRLQQILTPELLADELIRLLKKILEYEHGAVLLLDESSGNLIPFAVSDQGQWFASLREYKEYVAVNGLRLGTGVTGWVAQRGQSVCLGDVRNDPRYIPTAEETRSELCVPLTVGNKIIGVVNVESAKPNAYAESDQRLLETVAAQIAIAVQNARLHEDSARRISELEALYQSGLSLGESLDPREISERAVNVLAERLHWHHAAVRARRGASDDVELLALSQADKYGHIERVNTSRLMPGRAILKVGQGMAGWVIQHGQAINSGNLQEDPRYYATFHDMNSGLYAPIWSGGRVLGCISVESEQPNAFGQDDERLLATLASQAASALENARLYQDAMLAAERRSVLHQANQEIARLSQDSEQLYGAIYQAATRLMPVEMFTIALVNQAENKMDGVYVMDREERGPFISFPLHAGFSGRVVETNQTVLIEDYEDPNVTLKRVQFSDRQATRSILAVPLRLGEKVIGAMSVQSYQPGRYVAEDGALLEMLGAQAAVAIENARLFEQARRRIKEQESLNRASRSLTGSLELEPLLENILGAARDAIAGAEKGTILLWDKDSDHLHVRAQIGYTDARILTLPFRAEKGFAGRAFREKRPILVEDAYAEYEPPFDESIEEVHTIQSGIVAPLLAKDAAIGAIALDNATRKNAFTNEDLNLLTIFGSSAASAIENARLFEETRRRAEEFEALYQTAAEVSSETDLQVLMNTIMKRAQALSGASGSGIYLFDSERNDLELVAITDPNLRPGVRLALGEGLSGRVAQIKRPFLVNDYQTWENRSVKYEGYSYGGVLGIPMLYSGDLVGVLEVYNYHSENQIGPARSFGAQVIDLLSLFANSAAGAVYSARLLEKTRRRLDELTALAQVSSALRVASTRSDMMSALLEQLMSILRADGGYVISSVPGRDDLLIEAARGADADYAGVWIPPGKGISRRVIDNGQSETLADARQDPSFFNPSQDDKPYSIAIAPLKSQEQSIGAISMGRIGKDNIPPVPFSDDDLRLLNAVADMAANAFQRASLHEKTTRYAEQMEIINDLERALSETTDLPGIYEKISRAIPDLLPDTATIIISLFDSTERSIQGVYGRLDGKIINPADLPAVPFDESGHQNQSHVVLSGEPLIVRDFGEALKEKKAIPAKRENQAQAKQSAIYMPMKVEGRVIGVLLAQSYKKNRYASEDAKVLELVANAAAAAIQNARLFAQIKQRVDQLSALHAVDIAISATTDLRVSLQSVLENITRQLNVDAADVLLLNPGALVLQYVAGLGFYTSEITRASLSLGNSPAGRAARERRMIRISDLADNSVETVNDNLIKDEKFVSYMAVPLMAKGEVAGVLEIFQRSALALNADQTAFLDMLAGQAALAIDNALLFDGLERANVELGMAYDATIKGWSQALELRDHETQGHSARVLDLAARLAIAMGVSGRDLEEMRRGVLLHDIGKMGVPDSILHKPGALTDEEWEIMRRHPQFAYDMLAPIAYLRSSLDIPYCHHEKWDGSGYPRGLSGEAIPLPARIFAVVDVFDALTTDRPYRGAWSKEKTLEYIREQSGAHFDPRIVDLFLKFIQK